MFFIYSLLLTLAFLLLLPRFIFDVIRHGKYAAGFMQRAGSVPILESDAQRPFIWLHCVSVGETQAARPIVERLRAEHPEFRLVISTTTLTGQRTARNLFARTATQIIYFPFDWTWSVRRSLNHINPSLILVMETELWANFLRECGKRKIPVALVNGRLSPSSMRGYLRIRFFMRRVVKHLSLAIMQTEADAERIKSLGMDDRRIHVSGNVKFDVDLKSNEAHTRELQARFLLDSTRPLIVAASTHQREEQIALDAFGQLDVQKQASQIAAPRLLIAPRHPERFAEVAALIAKFAAANKRTWTRRTAPPDDSDATADIILLDSIGELTSVYRHAQIVLVGGSLTPHGGHNILEPAAANCCVITGAHTANFAFITEQFRRADALVELPDANEEQATILLADELNKLLHDAPRRAQLNAHAQTVLAANKGATTRTLEFLALLFDEIRDAQSATIRASNSPMTRRF